ncbi:MAG: M48 family metalloprotease [Desulfobacteraceae bacterium]
MFSNFIYFLVALIVYTTCHYPEGVDSPPEHALFYAFLSAVVFAVLSRASFNRLAARSAVIDREVTDHKLNNLLTRFSILALFLFGMDLYFFRLKLLFSDFAIFRLFPTLEAVLFLLLFLFYLVIVWDSAWVVQKEFFSSSVSKRNFVISNISFSLPALLPWFLLSVVADILHILPFPFLSDFLTSPLGEVSYVLVFLVAVAVFGPYMIRRLWRCNPLEPSMVRDRIRRVCSMAQLRYADILKWELFGGSMITAGVMGIWGRFRYILVTPALIRLLEDDEIDSVIAHEIGHVKNHHLLYYILFFAGYIGFIYFVFDPVMLLIYSGKGLFTVSAFLGVSHDTAVTACFSLFLILLFVLYFRYVFGFFMRNFERQADTYVFTLTRDPGALISTFNKIARFSGQSWDKPNWHHFSIKERVRFLEKCRYDESYIKQHDRKLKFMITGYVLVTILVFGLGYSVNFGSGNKLFKNYIAEKVLERKIRVEPENSDLYTIVGDYYYDMGKYEEARGAWENVLRIDPENLHALNNLAWLYATCEDKSLRNGKKALELSKKALEISREAFVLDTYAEACYVNNDMGNAVKAAKEALSKADSSKVTYYKQQLSRFIGEES